MHCVGSSNIRTRWIVCVLQDFDTYWQRMEKLSAETCMLPRASLLQQPQLLMCCSLITWPAMPDTEGLFCAAAAASAADVLLVCLVGSSAGHRVQHKPDLQDLLCPPAVQACCHGMVALDRDCGQSLRMATLREAKSGTMTGMTGPPQ